MSSRLDRDDNDRVEKSDTQSRISLSQDLAGGFNIYGVDSTSRSRRAEWEGRQLTAEVLAL